MVVNLDFDTILVWILVGLVAGFAASHLALGHGLGIVGDVVIGIVGAFIGGFFASAFPLGMSKRALPQHRALGMALMAAAVPLIFLRIPRPGPGARRRA